MMKKIMTAASLALITMSVVASSTFAADYAGRDARGNIQERPTQMVREAREVEAARADEAPAAKPERASSKRSHGKRR